MNKNTRYFIITGMGRTGTTWLAGIFNQHPDCFCTHEAFRPPTWPDAYEKWKNTDAPIVGDVNSHARFVIEQIDNDIHPLWIFCWRNPLELIHSIIARGGSAFNWRHRVFTRSSFWFKLRIVSTWVFGDIEVMLNKAEKFKINATHWHFDHYKTQEGVLEMAEYIGLDFEAPPDFDVFKNTHKNPQRGRLGLLPKFLQQIIKPIPKNVPHYKQWSDQEKRAILGVVDSLPAVSKAYEEAKKRFNAL